MAYKRIAVTDGVTVMNKELYDNLQDGVDDVRGRLVSTDARVDALGMNMQDGMDDIRGKLVSTDARVDALDTSMQEKVSKKTGSDELERAYTYAKSNQTSRPVSELPMKGALAVYNQESGNLRTGEPTETEDCVRRIDLDKRTNGPCYVSWESDDRVEVFIRGYDNRHDLQIVFALRGENDLMSIAGFYKIANSTGLLATEAKPGTQTGIIQGEANWISPHCVYAVSNADGDFPNVEDVYYTGGHYLYGNNVSAGTRTARTMWTRVFADGYAMEDGDEGRYAECVKLVWLNMLQGSNTQKQDGSGRAIVSEMVTVTCTGDGVLHVESEICALEDVQYREYRGMQMENGMEGALYFLGGNPDRRGHVVGVPVQSADCACYAVRLVGPRDTLEMEIDTRFGLGDGSLNDESFSVRAREDRISETSLLHQNTPFLLTAGSRLRWKGVYRLYPNGRPVYDVTYELTNVDTVTHQKTVSQGEPFMTDFKLERGVVLSGIEVEMDGVDVTDRVYSGGKIRIPFADGDISIGAVSARVYTNQIPISTDEMGHVYNGVGYLQSSKLDPDTGVPATSKRDVATTGFIPVPAGAVLHLDGMTVKGVHTIFAFYDSNKAYVCGMMLPVLEADETFSGRILTDDNGSVRYMDLSAFMAKYAAQGTPIAYVRGTFGEVNDRSVLTVNEEIVD